MGARGEPRHTCGMRCKLHDLACAPDGLCVVCRRAEAVSTQPEAAPKPKTAVWGVLGVVVATMAAAAVVRVHSLYAAPVATAAPTSASSSAPAALPSAGPMTAAPEQPDEASLSDVNVVVCTASWCSACKRAKAWMKQQGIAYEERDVEASSENAHAMRTLNPRGSVPTFDVDGEVMVGFSDQGLLASMHRAAHREAARRS